MSVIELALKVRETVEIGSQIASLEAFAAEQLERQRGETACGYAAT